MVVSVRNPLGIVIVLELCGALVCGCGNTASTASNTGEAANPAPTAVSIKKEKGVTLDEAMMQNVKIDALLERSLPRVLATTGKFQFNEEQMARVLAPVNGRIQQLQVKVGDRVDKGESLFVIQSREVASALDEYLESQKDLDLAEKTYTMNQDLFSHQAASRVALQQAENDLVKAKARVARTEESLRALGVEAHSHDPVGSLHARVAVRAPRNGIVIERPVTDGQFVQSDNNALITIADLSTVWVLADVFERDLHMVTVGQRAEVVTDAYPEQHFVAHVARIDPTVDPSTRTVKVRFLVANADGRLKPEMFATVALFLHESEQVLTVPPAAVFTEGGRSFAYVYTGEREFIRRQVEVEPTAEGLKILNGLQAGEHIISNGTLLVRLEENRQGMN
jgi:cobalt-zinc-cadmium efflux system membrane fusion protein